MPDPQALSQIKSLPPTLPPTYTQKHTHAQYTGKAKQALETCTAGYADPRGL